MFQTIISTISSFMYSKLLVIILIGAGVYFTVRTRFPQVRLFKRACGSVMEKPEDKGAISSFQALMVSTASRVGTGNIVGVSSAICIGGFGSVFWMWVIAIIGSASALIESTLAQIYKKKGEDGSCYGGPAYYIEAALHCRPLAIDESMDHRWNFGSADRMVSAWRRITYRKSNFNGCAGNGDCVYWNFTFGSNYQYSECAGNVCAHF